LQRREPSIFGGTDLRQLHVSSAPDLPASPLAPQTAENPTAKAVNSAKRGLYCPTLSFGTRPEQNEDDAKANHAWHQLQDLQVAVKPTSQVGNNG